MIDMAYYKIDWVRLSQQPKHREIGKKNFYKSTVQKIQAYQLRLWQFHAGDRQAIENMSEFQ